MTTLRLILGDQLSPSLSSLSDADPKKDVLLFCEVRSEATYVPHHPQKIILIFSGMRHFAKQLEDQGFTVRYINYDDPDNTGNLIDECHRAIKALKPTQLILTEPAEWRLRSAFMDAKFTHTHLELREDTRFLATHNDFNAWAKGKKQWRMEYFYRLMRERYQILMDKNGKPTGGQWNYDKENRKAPTKSLKIPERPSHASDKITQDVIHLVKTQFSSHFGRAEPFEYAVTAKDAQKEFDYFIKHLLPCFGDYQDAMLKDQAFLYHSRISAYLNCGLLLPYDLIKQAEKSYLAGKAPLNAVEGFIRQILGWREYIRGIYWFNMPAYANKNFLQATRPLPAFYWNGKTNMACMAEAIKHTHDHAYSHHIQRLMLTGNFALLAGLDVAAVQEWYLSVYADAYEWVEMPNTLGMALFGDGGIVASKPYAASGKYIQRMSNYCEHCPYKPDETLGPKACPFNALYWDFIARHSETLKGNQRMPYVLATWHRFSKEKQIAIRQQAEKLLSKLEKL
jgi:deoxyribodipyrimidine photolyase-related protein